jgi:hypothetical protein
MWPRFHAILLSRVRLQARGGRGKYHSTAAACAGRPSLLCARIVASGYPCVGRLGAESCGDTDALGRVETYLSLQASSDPERTGAVHRNVHRGACMASWNPQPARCRATLPSLARIATRF